jgi:hypothetical protein
MPTKDGYRSDLRKEVVKRDRKEEERPWGKEQSISQAATK